jgi:predicted AlkP superfamily phosphohydrolase/phosphomutase
MGRIVVLGLDGFNPELVRLWEHELPNLVKMKSEGIWGDIQSTVPPNTLPTWTSAQTGVNPGQFGFWDSTYRDDFSYGQPKFVDSSMIKPAPLYRYLCHKRAKKVAIINVPASSPPPEVPGGYAITDSVTPSLKQGFTWPDSLKNEVEELVGEYLLDASTADTNYRTMDKDLVLDRIYKMDMQRFALLKHFIKNKQCDYIFCVITGTERMPHLFYRYFDKTHKKFESNSKYYGSLKEHYKFIDAQIGEVKSSLDSDTSLFIHSAYCVQKLDGRINLNEWLIENQYMTLMEYPNELTKIMDLRINWSKTKAWATGYSGQIYLNLKGRESDGIVDPSEYSDLIDELGEALRKIPDENGVPLKTIIFRRDEINHGPLSKYGPDMFINFDECRWETSELVGYGKGGNIYSYDTPLGPDGASHGLCGFFCAAGPGIQAKGEKQGATLLDLAPTVLTILGEKVPNEMEGKSLVDQIADTEDMEKKVYDRLASLGY